MRRDPKDEIGEEIPECPMCVKDDVLDPLPDDDRGNNREKSLPVGGTSSVPIFDNITGTVH